MRIGVDIGGTKIEAALIDIHGKIHKNFRILTQASKGKKVVIQNIIKAISEVDDGRSTIGLGLPGVINKQGVLTNIPNIPCLAGTNVALLLKKTLNREILQDNDANCFAMAEHRFGAAKTVDNSIGIIIGTDIGGGIIINNRIHSGTQGAAGEIGYMKIDGDMMLKEYCGGVKIIKHYKKNGGKIENPTSKDIFESKDPVAKSIIDKTYKYLGIGMANMAHALNPDIIVFGGGVSNSLDYRRLNKEASKHLISGLTVKLVKNKLGDSSGVIGAAFL